MMRFTVFDRWDTQIGVLSNVVEAVHKDEVNGEDSLTLLLPTCDLEKGDRIVWRDKFSVWHEHIVNDLRDVHEDGKLYTSAYCENSIAELLTDYIEELRPYGVTAYTALQRALSVTRWGIGTVDVTGTASASFYHISAREAISLILENWGGELSTTITVSGSRVASRSVNITTRRGADNGKRFEWSKDIQGITREVSSDDVITALYGYGKGLEAYDDDGNLSGGYERKLTFGSINGGLDYVYDNNAKARWGHPDGSGGIKHSFGKVEFGDCEDKAELLALTRAELDKRKVPRVTYTANVIDLADAGFSYEDVMPGDTVQMIDRELDERLSGRVLCVERCLYNEQATKLTLGNVSRRITDVISSTQAQLSRLNSHAGVWDGAGSLSTSYINAVINSLNVALNQTGGYTYYEPGDGIITYDRPKDQNPTMAIQIKGAGFRIANSKTPDGDWNWRTFGTADGFTADMLNVGTIRGGSNRWNLNTGDLYFDQGVISSSDGNNFWNLGTGEFSLADSARLGNRTVGSILSTVDATITGVNIEYADNTSSTQAPTSGWSTTAPSWQEGRYIWSRTATTKAGRTTYSQPVCISGRDGVDGTDGEDGVGIVSTSITYGTSDSASAQPSSWSNTAPTSIDKGKWLWVKTVQTFTDNTSKTSYAKSYIGTDGEDGKSVYVQGTSKVDGVTTVTLSDGTHTTTLTIADGEDGANGTPGTNGLNGYVHVAWANSADGTTDFSTTVSAGRIYIGVYTDNTQADSSSPSAYSWSLIKGADGADGADGEDGVGIVSIVEQYYLSTSDQSQTGGSWSTTQPQWSSGKHIWTRSLITWDTTPQTQTTTAPVLAQALTQANSQAEAANDAVVALDRDLTQQEIFDRLTNNGQAQGIFLSNGRLYINGEYVTVDTLRPERIIDKTGCKALGFKPTSAEGFLGSDFGYYRRLYSSDDWLDACISITNTFLSGDYGSTLLNIDSKTRRVVISVRENYAAAIVSTNKTNGNRTQINLPPGEVPTVTMYKDGTTTSRVIALD